MSRENVRRIAVLRRDRKRPVGARLVTRLWLVAPLRLRDIGWRRFPSSRLWRAGVVDLARFNYERMNETGFVPPELFHPDVEVHQAAELIGTAGTFYGHEGLRAMMDELHDAWGVLEFEPQEIFEFGNRSGALVLARARNEGVGSGVVTDRQVAHVFWVRNGGIARFDVYWDPAEALEAVRLSE